MSEVKPRRGRVHDAAGAREAILNAAEKVFAEHGFDGARTDLIAAEAGYNKSLISAYFDGKLGLYAEVIRRTDEQTRDLQTPLLAALLEDGTVFTLEGFNALLKNFVNAYFDFLLAHPRFMRILVWEMAEGWQTFARIVTQRDKDDITQFEPLAEKLQKAGLLRRGFNPIAQITLLEFIIPCYMSSIPLMQMLVPAEDFSSAEALAGAREYIVDFIVQGIVIDPSDTKP